MSVLDEMMNENSDTIDEDIDTLKASKAYLIISDTGDGCKLRINRMSNLAALGLLALFSKKLLDQDR